MATDSSILAWRVPMDRGAWQATVHSVAESDMTEQLSTAHYITQRPYLPYRGVLALGKKKKKKSLQACLFIPLDIFSKQVILLLLASSQSCIRQSVMQTNHGDFALSLIKTVKQC